MKEEKLDVDIDWPQMVVSLGMIELTYDLDDILQIEGEGDAHILETTEYGLVIEYGESETEFIDMRPLTSSESLQEEM